MYGLSVGIVIVGTTLFFVWDKLFPEPTCFDKKQNGFEIGVDCGGVCSLRCASEVSPLTVEWAKAVPVDGATYDLAGLVLNNNIDNASRVLLYSFVLYDENGRQMGTVDGSTVAPLGGKFPIVVQNVALPKAPKNVTLLLKDTPHFRVKEVPTSPTVKVLERRYEVDSISRVYAKISNTKHAEINDLPVIVLLYDAKDNVYAVGSSVVPVFHKEETKEVSFTWTRPLREAPSRIVVYPIFNPFIAIGY